MIEKMKQYKRWICHILVFALALTGIGTISESRQAEAAEDASYPLYIPVTVGEVGTMENVTYHKKAGSSLMIGQVYYVLKKSDLATGDAVIQSAAMTTSTMTVYKAGVENGYSDGLINATGVSSDDGSIYCFSNVNSGSVLESGCSDCVSDGGKGAAYYSEEDVCWKYVCAHGNVQADIVLCSSVITESLGAAGSTLSGDIFRVRQNNEVTVYESGSPVTVSSNELCLEIKNQDSWYEVRSAILSDASVSDTDTEIAFSWNSIKILADINVKAKPALKGTITNYTDGDLDDLIVRVIDGAGSNTILKTQSVDTGGSFSIPELEAGSYQIEILDGNSECIAARYVCLSIGEDGTNNYHSAANFDMSEDQGKLTKCTISASSRDDGVKVDPDTINGQVTESEASENTKGFTAADKASGDTLKFEFRIKNPTSPPDAVDEPQINAVHGRYTADGYTLLNQYYKMEAEKTVGSVTTILDETNGLITIRVPVEISNPDFDLSLYDYRVYRYHDGTVECITSAPNAYGEYVRYVDGGLEIKVKRFCIYALAYGRQTPTTPPQIPYYPPTPTPTIEPTAEPTIEPTAEPTIEPTAEPTIEPTAEPTIEPTIEPTKAPENTAVPTVSPTAEPTKVPEEKDSGKVSSKKKMLLEIKKISGASMTLKWSKCAGADGYDVYHSPCDTLKKKNSLKYLCTIKKAKNVTYTLKKLKKNVWYKNRVYAWKMVNGKKVIIGESIIVHGFVAKKGTESKWGNPTDIELNKTKLTIGKGKTAKIQAKAVTKKGKSLGNHGRKVRYVVSDDTIVAVTKKGKAKGLKKGTCKLWVVAQNGLKKKIKITVK